jgi:hypothetical protein
MLNEEISLFNFLYKIQDFLPKFHSNTLVIDTMQKKNHQNYQMEPIISSRPLKQNLGMLNFIISFLISN